MRHRRLPHVDAIGHVQHIVFCIEGAYEDGSDDDALDQSPRGRLLHEPAAADIVEDVLLRRWGEGYWLHAWCVMPNHVHVLVEVRETPLRRIVQAWKSVSARELNAHWRRRGSVWQHNYFDRYMRDDAQFSATKHYIEQNPVAAGLATDPRAYRWSSAWQEE